MGTHFHSGQAESPFRTYDFRGVYGLDFTLETVYRAGRHLPKLLNAERVLVGRDARLTSPEISEALIRGLTDAGAGVVDMGKATTPMVYHFTAARGFDASVQVTASHNPPEYNGLKFSKRGALPVGAHNGLRELEALVNAAKQPKPVAAGETGNVETADFADEFVHDLRPWQSDYSNVRFAVDASDGVSGLIAGKLFGKKAVLLNCEPDGNFPNHGPNPLEPESREQLRKTVLKNKLDLGVIFDGDGDRAMFVDEKGGFVQSDFLIPVIARHFLAREPGAIVAHDIRTSRGAIEALRRDGAVPVMWKVGHVFLKELIRDTRAVCGGELAGHYYFRDFHCCDSAEIATLIVLEQFANAKRRGATFSQFIEGIRCYANSGEMNYGIKRKDEAIYAVRDAALALGGTPLAVHAFDGLRYDFPRWWVNVRKSNTEPYVRLIIEAETPGLLASVRQTLAGALKPFAK